MKIVKTEKKIKINTEFMTHHFKDFRVFLALVII